MSLIIHSPQRLQELRETLLAGLVSSFRKTGILKPEEMYQDAIDLIPDTHFFDEWDRGKGLKVEGEGHNLITNPMRLLIASALVGDQNYYADSVITTSGRKGIQYWAVGSGNPLDDVATPAAPSVTDTKLYAEIARVPITLTYVDNLGNPTVGGATSRSIQVQATFGVNVANGNNIEFGLYGGNATTTADSGLLLNRVTHPLKYKNTNDIRRLTIVFSL